MFQNLTEKLANAFKKFKSKGKLTEADVKEGMREVKLALLEADVNFKVVKEFVKSVTERAVGAEVLESLLPAQQIVKIVNEELIKLMGGETPKINISPKPPTVIMMVGLQGAGKTTHSGKIAGMYKQKSKNPLLVACDVYRPAAVDQLKIVGDSLGIPVFSMGTKISPVEIAKAGVEHAKKNGHDMVIIDTAGRLHIDEELMDELVNIKNGVDPAEILLVVDAMTGQDAVNVAKSFNDLLDITGVVMTKMDGDTRGGAALSVKYITGKPIKFVGMGEKLDQIELFHPDRMASRILGMGDILSLIEKAEAAFDEKNAKELEKKMREQTFSLEDFLDQMRQLKKMGNLDQILAMMPGANTGALKNAQVDEKQMDRIEAMILSMTPSERLHPEIINGSRRKRIAMGSGTQVEDLNRLLRQFDQMKKMMKQFSGKNMKKLAGMRFPM
ncbi:MAG: signal recognition particle protein [Clostridia bacterium]|nr:signal recognition particle protein [Clostridia bacterium]MBO5315911.1 signal recognition particle protein [Clostridia bacterium]